MSAEQSTPSVHLLELDDYEAANLAAALLFLGNVGGDTGDWYQQILNKLSALEIQTAPNKPDHQQRRDLALRIGWDLLWGGR